MSENTQLSDSIKEQAEKTLEKLESHEQKIGQPQISDVSRYVITSDDINTENAKEIVNYLLEKEAIKIDGDRNKQETEITEIEKNNLIEESESYKPLLDKEFDNTIYRQVDSKQELAQEYANWLIEEANITPVWIGDENNSTTTFYRFNPLNNTWSEIQFEMICKKAKKDLGKDYNQNMKRELKNQLTDHYKYIEFDEMGLEPEELLLKNGTVLDLITCETREIEKSDYALNCLDIEYVENAESQGLEQFIERTLDTEEMVETFQEFLGYSLKWPSKRYEKMLLILGYTDTGKSTLLEVIKKLFEESNVTDISFPQIGMDRAFHVSKLKDSVLNIDSDMDDQNISRKSRIKKVVSKESVNVEPKGESSFSITPKANFIVASNNAPDDAGATDAYYNRFLTLTATNRVSEEEKDRDLLEKLTTEENMQWLLNWAIEGLHRLEEQNHFTCNRTEYETKKVWDRFGNSVQKFISQEVVLDKEDGYNVPTTDLYEAYQLWCETQLEKEVTQRKFISQAASHPDLVKRKASAKDGSRRMCFVNIKVPDFAI